MSFDVQVVFSGLVVLAPIRETGQDDAIWALMVKENGHVHGGHDMPPHIPSVLYDVRDAGKTDEQLVHQPLRPQLHLPISGKVAGDIRTEFGKIPGNVSRAFNVFAKHRNNHSGEDWFNPGQIHRYFAAQIRLTKVTKVEVSGESCWDFGALGPTEMVTHVACTLEGFDQPQLDVPVRGGTLSLKPHDGQTLQVGFFNVPSEQLPGSGASEPPPPPAGGPPEHFPPYQRVFGLTDAQYPKFVDKGPCTSRRERYGGDTRTTQSAMGILARRGVFPYACLTLPGCPDDDPNCSP